MPSSPLGTITNSSGIGPDQRQGHWKVRTPVAAAGGGVSRGCSEVERMVALKHEPALGALERRPAGLGCVGRAGARGRAAERPPRLREGPGEGRCVCLLRAHPPMDGCVQRPPPPPVVDSCCSHTPVPTHELEKEIVKCPSSLSRLWLGFRYPHGLI